MLYKPKMHFFRDSGVSNVLASSCVNYTLRFCARCFLALTKKSQFLEVSLGGNFNKPNKFEEAKGGK